jgi:hypothetical protein
MKNIHVLPTDKPSRIRIGSNGNFVMGLTQNENASKNDSYTNQNIYITSDKEIKDGDYGLSKLNEIVKFHSGYDYRYYAKIILTTDQDLIKDGVQAIDDEFLEWFVKNPSCEEVEVEMNQGRYYDYGGNVHITNAYKIIIPKEEPKTGSMTECIKMIIDNQLNELEEPKQTAVELLKQRLIKDQQVFPIYNEYINGILYDINNELLEMEKQQQGYSEEEMLKMLHKFGFDYTYNYKGEKTIYEWIPEWFEEYKRLNQFKNK